MGEAKYLTPAPASAEISSKLTVPTPCVPLIPLTVLLTAIDVRRFVRKLIEGEFPDMSVLSYQEIVPEIRVQPLGRVQLS